MEKISDNNAIKQRNERYEKYVNAVTPKTSLTKSLAHSFWIGGLTCMISQGIADVYAVIFPATPQDMIATYALMTVVAIAIFLTGLGIFDKFARYGGAGLFLPITGFANAMSSAAMEYRAEGLIFGTDTKMFTVVGPVVINGVVWSTLVGLIHLIISAVA